MIMPGRAVAALQAVLLPEAFLDRVQLAVLGQALDRRDARRRRPGRRTSCTT